MERLDEFSKLLAKSVSRRESLRSIGAAIAGVALSSLGAGSKRPFSQVPLALPASSSVYRPSPCRRISAWCREASWSSRTSPFPGDRPPMR